VVDKPCWAQKETSVSFLNVCIFIYKNKMKHILISEKQLEIILREQKSLNETQEQKDSMSKKQLFTIATLAYNMWEQMSDDEQLEDWMESKIAQCEQSVISVVKNYMYDELVDDTNGNTMNKINYDELVIGK
jgi:hypothetical protein